MALDARHASIICRGIVQLMAYQIFATTPSPNERIQRHRTVDSKRISSIIIPWTQSLNSARHGQTFKSNQHESFPPGKQIQEDENRNETRSIKITFKSKQPIQHPHPQNYGSKI